jgi:hypothetical protein
LTAKPERLDAQLDDRSSLGNCRRQTLPKFARPG